MDRAIIKAAAKQQIKGNIGIMFLISLLVGLISGALVAIPVVGAIADALIVGAFSLAIIDMYMGMAEGKKPKVADLFSRMKDVLPAFCTSFLTGLFVALWSLLLMIPGIVKACSYSQAMYILAEDPSIGPMEAIRRSKAIMEGHKMEYFKLLLSFFGWAILGTFTLGILYIWLTPYMSATFANYYRYLKGEKID